MATLTALKQLPAPTRAAGLRTARLLASLTGREYAVVARGDTFACVPSDTAERPFVALVGPSPAMVEMLASAPVNPDYVIALIGALS